MACKPDRSRSTAHGGFRIAGISLRVTGIPGNKARVRNRLYHRFLLAGNDGGEGPAIAIRIRNTSPPLLATMKKVFDTGESWSLYADEKRFWVVYQPPLQPAPFWVAGFDRRASRVDFHSPAAGGPVHPIAYPLDQLLLMHYFAGRRGMLTHAAGWVHGGKAYLFAGASGAGKSTISGLLAATGAGRMLSDERMIVREIRGKMTAFGTPWAGTAGIARAGQAPLAGIFFLKHGKANRIEELEPAAAADRLLPMISIPWYDADAAAPVIAFARRVCAAVPCREFSFTPDRAAVDLIAEFTGKPA